MGLGSLLALAAGLGCGGLLWGWLGPVCVPGMSWDCLCVWVVVGPPAGFPGGLAVFPVSLWSPDGACSPVPRSLPCMLAGPSPPLPAFSAHPVCATGLCSLPLSGAEPALPHVGVVLRPLLASGVPEAGWCVGSLVCVGDMGAAGAWRETVLPGWLVALGCVVLVGVSTCEGAGGHQSVVPGVLWDGPCAGRHLVVTSCGGPWWLTCASPTPPWVALSHAPRGGVWPLHQHHPHSMVLALRGCTLLVPFSVCLPQSACCLLLPGAVPWCVLLPGLPRSRPVACFAAACPSPPLRAG